MGVCASGGGRVVVGLMLEWVVCDEYFLAGCMVVGVGEVRVRWLSMLSFTKGVVCTYLLSSMLGVYGIYGCGRVCVLFPPLVYSCGHL